jgi:hypothetical protein
MWNSDHVSARPSTIFQYRDKVFADCINPDWRCCPFGPMFAPFCTKFVAYTIGVFPLEILQQFCREDLADKC